MEANHGPGTRARFDRENVETARPWIDAARAEKLAGHAHQIAALLLVHGLFGARLARFLGRTRLDLDEGKRRAVVTHHVNFTFDARRSVIARDERVTMAAEIPVSVGLATDSGATGAIFRRRIGSGSFRKALASGEIDVSEHEAREHR